MEKIIITVGHEYCSGGREIGKETADRLGIAYYDSEIIDEAAKTSGLSAEYIKRSEENVTSSFLYNVVMNAGYASSFFNQSKETLPLDTQVYLAQQEAILQKWGDVYNYDLTIDTGRIGLDEAVSILEQYV